MVTARELPSPCIGRTAVELPRISEDELAALDSTRRDLDLPGLIVRYPIIRRS
jgi:hypothetical protein